MIYFQKLARLCIGMKSIGRKTRNRYDKENISRICVRAHAVPPSPRERLTTNYCLKKKEPLLNRHFFAIMVLLYK